MCVVPSAPMGSYEVWLSKTPSEVLTGLGRVESWLAMWCLRVAMRS